MSGQLEIRICKETIIQEIERLYTLEKADYFKSIAQQIVDDSSFYHLSYNLPYDEYTGLFNSIKRFQSSSSDYYQNAGKTIKSLLNLKDARIWTRKETLEINEALFESFDSHTYSVFGPLLLQVEHGMVFLLLLKQQD